MSRTDPLAVRFFIIVLFFSGVAGEREKRVADDGRHSEQKSAVQIRKFNNLTKITRMSRGRVYPADDNSHRIPMQLKYKDQELDPWTCLEVLSLEIRNTRCKYNKIHAFTSDNGATLPQPRSQFFKNFNGR